jgi:NAD(P)-dependent dehydrogenase (short-subunit alcohol dehydrogenase family)
MFDTPNELEGKVIVDVTSYASYMPFPQTAPYGASKAAFSFLMRHVQIEHPKLRVYTLHPGAVWGGFGDKQGHVYLGRGRPSRAGDHLVIGRGGDVLEGEVFGKSLGCE